jgi:hypothetical protein
VVVDVADIGLVDPHPNAIVATTTASGEPDHHPAATLSSADILAW